MKPYIQFSAAALSLSILASTAGAQLYWDIDTVSQPGAGGATPSGTWDVGVTANWNSNADGNGLPGVWADLGDAVFAAGSAATGSYAVTLAGTVAPNSIAFKDSGSVVTITGGTSLDLSNTATIDVSSGARGAIDSIMGGSSQIIKNGGGTLDLTNANTFSGMQLNAGTVRVNNNNALGSNLSSVAIADGTTLAATSSTARTLTYVYNVAGNFTLGQASGGTGALTLGGAAASGATMDLGGGVRTITVNNASDTISALISNGGIIKEGTGTLTLSAGVAANTYTGAITVNAGILSSTATTGLGTSAGGVTVNSGATLQVSGGNTQLDTISLSGTGSTGSNGALLKTGNNTTTIGNTSHTDYITGTGSVVVNSTGTLTLNAQSPGNPGFTGPFIVKAGGTLKYPDQVNLGTTAGSGTITLDNGILYNTKTGNAGSFSPSSRNIVLGAGGGTLRWDGDTVATDLIIVQTGTVISGSAGGALNKTGVGVLAIATPATYDGPTHVAAGTLRVRSGNERFPNGTALTVDADATFDVDGLTETVGSLAGAGTLEINAGQFNVGGNNGTTTFSGQFTGTGGKVTKQGTGVFTVTGDNIQTGLTTVSAGTLLVNNISGSGTGTGTVTVASAGKLGGTGTISGAITNNGTITPGDGVVVGTLHASNNVTDGANSHWAIELSGSSSDQVAVGGILDLSAVDTLDVTGTGTGPWIIATYTGSRNGMFDSVTTGYTVDYDTAGQIILKASAAVLPGDFNSDGKVDAGDYVTWRKNSGTNNALANDNGLGVPIGLNHYNLWRANFGNPSGAGTGGGLASSSAVPEPGTLGLVAIGLAMLAFRRLDQGNPK